MRKYSYYIISSLLLSATIFVGGCVLTQKSNPISTPTVSSTGESIENVTVSLTADEVDTSNWKTYRNEQAGFEVKISDAWEKTNEIIHLDENGIPTTTEKLVLMDDHDELALSSKGFLYFELKGQEYMDSNMVNFSIESFDSNLDLDILREKYDRFSDIQTVITSADMDRVISSLKNDALSLVKKGDHQDSWNFSHHILIKNGHEYFLIGIFTVASSEGGLRDRISEYLATLQSFQPTSVQ